MSYDLNKCVKCSGIAQHVIDARKTPIKFTVECTKCGFETKGFLKRPEAFEAWNNIVKES